MQKTTLITVVAALFLAITPSVYANPGTDNGQNHNKSPWERAEKNVIKIEKEALTAQREEIRKEFKSNREEFKTKITQYKSERKDFMSSKSAELKAAMQANKEEFRTKLAAIKDERKKLTAEKVDTKLASINTKQTDIMSNALVRLQEILNKLIDRTNAAKTAGADTTATETAINNAKTAIAAAEASLASQKTKTYTATVTDETSLGQAFKVAFTQLRTDLKTTHDAVKAAKSAVKQVAVELRKVETPTPTGTTTPTDEVTPTP